MLLGDVAIIGWRLKMIFHCKQLRMRSLRTDHFWREFQNANEYAGVCQRSGCSLIGCPVF